MPRGKTPASGPLSSGKQSRACSPCLSWLASPGTGPQLHKRAGRGHSGPLSSQRTTRKAEPLPSEGGWTEDSSHLLATPTQDLTSELGTKARTEMLTPCTCWEGALADQLRDGGEGACVLGYTVWSGVSTTSLSSSREGRKQVVVQLPQTLAVPTEF